MRLTGVVVGVAALAAAGIAGAQPGGAGKPFAAYASCGAKGKHGDRFCFAGDHPVAVFRAYGRRDVAYRVCARRKGHGRRCADRRTNNPGQRSRTQLPLDGVGRYQLAWFEDGRAVDRDRLVVRQRSAFLVGDSLSQGTKPYIPRALCSASGPTWQW